ncbi:MULTISPECIES: inositol monophosphatase family protein [unclassified Paenibacillus]|uniref:inositol monophosphatase family protein n=1 Tax=unclassified Paenibacillus TaxID=185978 RepID=UPI000BA5A577|nr:inositol monophosphatase family protein [Paenibacillus sp. 7523-1]PAD29949.1 inositol monophosphatase [Paenibacillus sp. 7523-1]
MEQTIRLAQEIAERVIREAGQIARVHFDQITCAVEKDKFGDVVTDVDHETERIICDAISHTFPAHEIHSEERGHNGQKSEWLWMIDPLDGTNNYAIGFPVFSVSITLMYRSEPVLGVIYEPMVDRLFVASRGNGASCNLNPLTVNKKDNLLKGTIGWIQGHQVQHEENAVRLRQHLDIRFKRVMRLWAPTLQWCLLAKGDIDGIVLYNSEGDDLYSGILMVKEAGAMVMDFDGNLFEGMSSEPYLIACHPEHRDYFLSVVREGLGV